MLAHVIILLVAGGSVVAAVSGRELWPFSPYPMYSWVEHDRRVSRLQLYGVAGNPPSEFPLRPLRHLHPFDDARLTTALWRLWHEPNYADALRAALAYCLIRYEALRQEHRHADPPLEAMRLYLLEWDAIDPWARTADRPDRRVWVLEVRPQ